MALIAEGRNLALVWHKGVCQGRDQNLGVAVWDMAEHTQAWSGSLPLSPGATLTWLGFSEAGMLAAYDSQVRPELGGLHCRLGMRGTCFPQMGLEGTMLYPEEKLHARLAGSGHGWHAGHVRLSGGACAWGALSGDGPLVEVDSCRFFGG